MGRVYVVSYGGSLIVREELWFVDSNMSEFGNGRFFSVKFSYEIVILVCSLIVVCERFWVRYFSLVVLDC